MPIPINLERSFDFTLFGLMIRKPIYGSNSKSKPEFVITNMLTLLAY